MIYIGIDPGQSGAVGFVSGLDDDGGIWSAVNDCPKNEGDMAQLLIDMVSEFVSMDEAARVAAAVVEDVHAMPKQGVSSTFKFGRNFGTWLGILAALKIPFELVTPRTWQKQFFKKADGKLSAFNTARRLFPDAPLTGARGAIKDGRADALLMAYWLYQRRK